MFYLGPSLPFMPSKIQPFKSILFGFAFSPSLRVNVLETARIAHFFGAKLLLLHVGEKSQEKSDQINKILAQTEYPNLEVEILWKSGDPFNVISNTCKISKIDLLILGAMQHENMFQFYVGSIARKLTRKVCCSVLLLIKPSAERVPCNHIVVNGLDAPETHIAITDAFYAANAFGAQQLTIVEEILQKEIHVTVEDDRSLKKANIVALTSSQSKLKGVDLAKALACYMQSDSMKIAIINFSEITNTKILKNTPDCIVFLEFLSLSALVTNERYWGKQ